LVDHWPVEFRHCERLEQLVLPRYLSRYVGRLQQPRPPPHHELLPLHAQLPEQLHVLTLGQLREQPP
jgi:hypothetical protein